MECFISGLKFNGSKFLCNIISGTTPASGFPPSFTLARQPRNTDVSTIVEKYSANIRHNQRHELQELDRDRNPLCSG